MISYEILYKLKQFKMMSEYTSLNNIVQQIFNINLCINDWINIKYDNAKCSNCNSNIITLETNQSLLNRMSDT